MLLLGIYLLLVGLGGIIALGIPVVVTAAVALCAGVLILTGR
jgi:hypothetical protein